MIRDLADRVMKARKSSTCPLCLGPIRIGQYIARTGTTWQHASCLVQVTGHAQPGQTAATEQEGAS